MLPSQVKEWVLFSECSGATCARPFCAAVVGVALYYMPECLSLDEHDFMCVPVCLKLHLPRGTANVGHTIGKRLGLPVDPSGSCSAQQATPPGSL